MRTDEGGREDGGGTRVKGVVQAGQQQVQVPPTPSPPPVLNINLGNFSKELQGVDHFPRSWGGDVLGS